MDTKIKSFLRSDFFILVISIAIGVLCHLFVTTKIVESKEAQKDPYYTPKRAFTLPSLSVFSF